jgi:multiple sugar transport system ATP-binding protein
MAEIRLEGITKRFGAIRVFESLSLTVRDGELFTIVGPSGCGKSTLLHLIAGLDQPTSGRIYFDQGDVTDMSPRERDVALVFQNYALYPHMTVAENLSFPLRVARRTRLDREGIEQEVRRTAGLLGLETLLDRRPRELSGGQRQRVALGRALIRKPRVMLLDEPLSNLDAQLRAGMRGELRRLHDETGTTMIYVTHDQTEALALADRLAVLHEGRLQQVGTPAELYRTPANVFVAGFIGNPPMNLLEAEIKGGEARAGPLRLPLAGEEAREGQRVTVGVRPEMVRISAQPRDVAESLPDKGSVTGVVRLMEPAGTNLWVTLEIGEGEHPVTLVGLGEPNAGLRPGRHVTASLQVGMPYLFDRETGVRLGHGNALKANGSVHDSNLTQGGTS